ncbi:unnamed protein product [Boreogadus saida]
MEISSTPKSQPGPLTPTLPPHPSLALNLLRELCRTVTSIGTSGFHGPEPTSLPSQTRRHLEQPYLAYRC